MIFLCGFMGDLWAQTTATQPLVNQLAESYNNFNYEETDRLLGIALESIGQFLARPNPDFRGTRHSQFSK
ncbi:MAG: hypothetical protein R3C26_10555 [Calditrichia bacterium]